MKNKHKAIAAAGIAAAAAGVIGHRVAAARRDRADADTLRQAYESLNGQERLTDPGNYFQAVALPADIQVRLLTARQAANMSEGTVFFGFPTCPWCRNALPLALEAAAGAGGTLCYWLSCAACTAGGLSGTLHPDRFQRQCGAHWGKADLCADDCPIP